MASQYKIYDSKNLHFITFATVQWIDVFTREWYRKIVVESLIFCQHKKGLNLHAWCLMSNHIHLIASAKTGSNLSDILRDFKKYTSKKIVYDMEKNPLESRKNWMLWLFRSAGKFNKNNEVYQFWQQDNRPIELETNEMIDQRLDYLHNNPVEAGIVREPQEYVYSSAINYCGGKGLINVSLIDL